MAEAPGSGKKVGFRRGTISGKNTWVLCSNLYKRLWYSCKNTGAKSAAVVTGKFLLFSKVVIMSCEY